MENVLTKLKIERRNDLIGYLLPYEIKINNKLFKIKAGEINYFDLDKENNTIVVEFMYFRKKIEINRNCTKNLLIRTFMSNTWFIIIMLIFILNLIIISFGVNIILFNTIVEYLGIGFLSILIYYSTIGKDDYISIDFVD